MRGLMVCALFLIIGFSSHGVRAFESGLTALEEGLYQDAYRIWSELKEENDPGGMFGLGWLYETGNGADQDIGRAFELYQMAADLDHAPAMSRIGYFYMQGIHVENDSDVAESWFRRAVAKDHTAAKARLAYLLLLRSGMKSVPDEAIELVLDASRTQHPEAVSLLELFYGMGQLWDDQRMVEATREQLLLLAHEEQHPLAMRVASLWYRDGQGIERDPDLALNLLSDAARQGEVKAQYELAKMYQDGVVVERDSQEAVRWMRRAADQGFVDAQMALAMLYLQGEIVKANQEESKRLLQQVVEAGDSFTLWRLAREVENLGSSSLLREAATALYKQSALKTPAPNLILQQGAKASPSLNVAMAAFELEHYGAAKTHWKSLDEKQRSPEAQYMLGHVFEHGFGVEPDMDKAEQWYAKSASQGYEKAMKMVERMFDSAMEAYRRGDLPVALAGWERAARQGDVAAMYNAGLMHRHGEGSPVNMELALEWWLKAAEEGHAKAQADTGRAYFTGDGVGRDLDKAHRWLLSASHGGDSESQFLLARMYEEGLGVDQNHEKAFEWYTKSALQGYGPAQNNLGVMYARGNGITSNTAWAVYWYAKAAQNDIPEAERNISAELGRLFSLEVTVDLANIRSGPSMAADVIGQLPKGTRIYRLDVIDDDWFEVYVADGHGLGFIAESVVGQAGRRSMKRPATNFPPAPEPRAGYTTCSTRCFNSDCYRTYSDGTQVRFQARRSWDPFRNQMTWDSGSC